jgi:hypothetical protein
MLIDYIDDKLSVEEQLHIEKELRENESSLQLYEQLKTVIHQMEGTSDVQPSVDLRTNFDLALKEEISKSKKGKQIFFPSNVLRMAAGFALLITGLGLGFWINKTQEQQREMARLREEMNATKQLMMNMMANQQSASQRMLGVEASYQLEKADDEIVNALLKTMNTDPNTNVRLAALEALGKFHQQEHVRKALIASLSKQNDPVVQISLIRLMVEMKEKSVIKELEKMTKDKENIRAVKDEAYAGMLKLS